MLQQRGAMADQAACTCGQIKIGTKSSDHRNWRASCPIHGAASKWYNSAEQVERREQQRIRLKALQMEAAAARAALAG
jgi:hypothetical protein